MSTTYSGNASNNPSSITIPSDGDARNVSSVNPAFEGLMDKVRHILEGATAFTGAKTLVLATITALTIGALTTNVTPGSGEHRKLLWTIPIGGGIYVRIYSRAEVASPQFYAAGLEVTVNAAWNNGATQWEADVGAQPARILEIGGTSSAGFAGDDTMLRLRRKAAPIAAGWNYDAWDAVILALGVGNPSATAAASVVPANSFFSKAFPKSWGVVTTDGSGNVSIENGYGLASVALAGSAPNRDVRVTLRHAMASTTYGIMVAARLPVGATNYSRVFAVGKPVTTTTFDISWPTPWGGSTAGDQYDAGAGTPLVMSASFAIFGEQS